MAYTAQSSVLSWDDLLLSELAIDIICILF